jgi:ABC-type spermidine/putrescine transport system permease subunit I
MKPYPVRFVRSIVYGVVVTGVTSPLAYPMASAPRGSAWPGPRARPRHP